MEPYQSSSVESVDALLKVSDDKFRVNIPAGVRSYFNLIKGSNILLTYLKLPNQNYELLPFQEVYSVGSQHRFTVSDNVRTFLGLKKDDYFVANIKPLSPANCQDS
jgi:DNA-binding transcriptional regulator/RsmH inhibitor MraZ